MAYFNGVMANGLKKSDLPGVTTIPDGDLQKLVDKFNFVRNTLVFKGYKQAFLTYLEQLGLKKTEQLVAKLNDPVPDRKKRLKRADPAGTLKGPMLLLYLIDYMWQEILVPVAANQIVPYGQMVDPVQAGGTANAMLSAEPQGFKKYGICFRGDTRAFHQFSSGGFVARFAVPPGDPFHVEEAWGTVAAEGMAFDRQAMDFANQTGVCVARNIVGSMKFIGNAQKNLKTGVMYALKFHTGVDTEAMQVQKQATAGASALWRAGEKAAWEIPKWRFIGSCPFEVDHPYAEDQPTFRYRRTGNWTFHWAGVSQVRAYVEKSTEKMPIGQWQDFSATDDWARA